jgi:hypothetical protein
MVQGKKVTDMSNGTTKSNMSFQRKDMVDSRGGNNSRNESRQNGMLLDKGIQPFFSLLADSYQAMEVHSGPTLLSLAHAAKESECFKNGHLMLLQTWMGLWSR